jgi:hypothetical protein
MAVSFAPSFRSAIEFPSWIGSGQNRPPQLAGQNSPPNLPENLLISAHFLKKYPQFYHRELPDYRFYLP